MEIMKSVPADLEAYLLWNNNKEPAGVDVHTQVQGWNSYVSSVPYHTTDWVASYQNVSQSLLFMVQNESA